MHACMTLDRLLPGCFALVEEVQAQGITRRRLLDLGLVPGTIIQAIHRSPLGDPTAYQIRGAIIALRQEDTLQIRIIPFEGT
ncbi:MAG TPA: ferrous iron transport protein A [Syntrophomonadaceae bacterium]|nr:ferrous iron transport protein A [Syntrophomonadaceae bacterium]